ncbi:MAG: hypothetical protein ABEK50_09885 [bacterium]
MNLLRLACLVLGGGLLGAAIVLKEWGTDTWWVSVGLALFITQVLFLDLDSFPDLTPLMLFAALGMGQLATYLNHRSQVLLVLIVTLLIPLNAFGSYVPGIGYLGTGTMNLRAVGASLRSGIQFGPLGEKGQKQSDKDKLVQGNDTRLSRMYWSKQVPRSCYYRKSIVEQKWKEHQLNHRVNSCKPLSYVELFRILKQ